MKYLNIYISCNHKDLEEFIKLKMEMETREEKHNEKDVKKTYNKQYKWYNTFNFFGLEMT